MTTAILSRHRRVPPFGLAGGQAGQVGRSWVKREAAHQEADSSSAIVLLGSKAEVTMQPGDVFVIETPGGGDYGTT